MNLKCSTLTYMDLNSFLKAFVAFYLDIKARCGTNYNRKVYCLQYIKQFIQDIKE